jgi:hypothetical protein
MLIPSQLEVATYLKMDIRITFYLTDNKVYFRQKGQEVNVE